MFTDIEGSTRRWEADPERMRVASAAHDDVLRVAIESHGGWLFEHGGNGCNRERTRRTSQGSLFGHVAGVDRVGRTCLAAVEVTEKPDGR